MTISAVEEAPVEQLKEPRIFRTFPVELSVSDGRTLDVRIVPYNEFTTVGDPPWNPEVVYREAFMPGAFDRQLNAPNRIVMDVEHEGFKLNQGFESWIAHATHVRSEPDGFYGTFDVYEGAREDRALELVNKGVLTAISMEFVPKTQSGRPSDGIVKRTRVHLDKVALLREGAYENARVLALREQPITMAPEDLAQPLPEDTVRKLRAAGLEVPAGLLPAAAARSECEHGYTGDERDNCETCSSALSD